MEAATVPAHLTTCIHPACTKRVAAAVTQTSPCQQGKRANTMAQAPHGHNPGEAKQIGSPICNRFAVLVLRPQNGHRFSTKRVTPQRLGVTLSGPDSRPESGHQTRASSDDYIGPPKCTSTCMTACLQEDSTLHKVPKMGAIPAWQHKP